jgi:hypothetical protein
MGWWAITELQAQTRYNEATKNTGKWRYFYSITEERTKAKEDKDDVNQT